MKYKIDDRVIVKADVNDYEDSVLIIYGYDSLHDLYKVKFEYDKRFRTHVSEDDIILVSVVESKLYKCLI